jgi:hypothetical protein
LSFSLSSGKGKKQQKYPVNPVNPVMSSSYLRWCASSWIHHRTRFNTLTNNLTDLPTLYIKTSRKYPFWIFIE